MLPTSTHINYDIRNLAWVDLQFFIYLDWLVYVGEIVLFFIVKMFLLEIVQWSCLRFITNMRLIVGNSSILVWKVWKPENYLQIPGKKL